MRRISNLMRSRTVLVVGSDSGERSGIVAALSRASMAGELAVIEANLLEQALVVFRRDHPDVILIGTEVIMPIGRELARIVREEEGIRHTGIIFIERRVENAGDEQSVVCLEMGADDFLRYGASDSELMARLRAVLRIKAMTDELRGANHQLRLLSMTDELTGLGNMRSFNQSFAAGIRNCRNGLTSLAIIMLDLDHFKSVNDATNHLVGSHVLAEIGKIFRQERLLRESDIAARFGGDEFIVLLEAKNVEEAANRAEAIRRHISAHTFESNGCTIKITASVGVAWAAAGFNGRAEDLVKAADLMLYDSKGQGRDQVSSMVLDYPIDFGDGIGHSLSAHAVRAPPVDDLGRKLKRG